MGRKKPQQPWWSVGPCPTWCAAPHDEDGTYSLPNRMHYGDNVGTDQLDLSLMPPYEDHGHRDVHCLAVFVEQQAREIEPHLCLEWDENETVKLTLAEARTLLDWLAKAVDQAEGVQA